MSENLSLTFSMLSAIDLVEDLRKIHFNLMAELPSR